jgi:hypothetical protein
MAERSGGRVKAPCGQSLLACGSGTADHRPSDARRGPPAAAHSPLGAAVGGGAIGCGCGQTNKDQSSPRLSQAEFGEWSGAESAAGS